MAALGIVLPNEPPKARARCDMHVAVMQVDFSDLAAAQRRSSVYRTDLRNPRRNSVRPRFARATVPPAAAPRLGFAGTAEPRLRGTPGERAALTGAMRHARCDMRVTVMQVDFSDLPADCP